MDINIESRLRKSFIYADLRIKNLSLDTLPLILLKLIYYIDIIIYTILKIKVPARAYRVLEKHLAEWQVANSKLFIQFLYLVF